MRDSERICIYCEKPKPNDDFSLEHVIPQFLGGACTPDKFKTSDVCRKCNSDLGLFVDAAFEKDFLISNELRQAAYALYDPQNPSALPLICMGAHEIDLPGLEEDEICELWLGPLGEQVYWVRPHDERMYWYTGGNPRTSKTKKTRAYFFFSVRSEKAPEISMLSFKEAFSGKRVKKIMGTEVQSFDMKKVGFEEPDDTDSQRLHLLREGSSTEKADMKCRISMNINHDYRFIAKLALGISHALFKNGVNKSGYLKELHKAVWYKDGEEQPEMRGKSSGFQQNDFFSKTLGVEHAVTLSILSSPHGVGVNLDIGKKRNWFVLCCESNDLTESQLLEYGEGRSYVIFRSARECIELNVPHLIAHNSGNIKHARLNEIQERANKHSNYFANL